MSSTLALPHVEVCTRGLKEAPLGARGERGGERRSGASKWDFLNIRTAAGSGPHWGVPDLSGDIPGEDKSRSGMETVFDEGKV